jgi:hypothetical protein
MNRIYDMYVNGIDPQRAGELEDIKHSVGMMLNIQGSELDAFFSFKAGAVCIQKGISEQGAIIFHRKLLKMGLLCFYQPRQVASRWDKLSLQSIEETAVNFFTCPACQTQQAMESEEPKICPKCGENINVYRQDQKDKQEYEEIRQKLLRNADNKLNYEHQQKRKEREKRRKQLLEQQIAKDLGLQPKSKWQTLLLTFKKTKKSHVLIASIIAVTASGWGAYTLFQQQNNDPLAITMADVSGIPEQVSAEAPFNIAGVVDAMQLPSSSDFVDIDLVNGHGSRIGSCLRCDIRNTYHNAYSDDRGGKTAALVTTDEGQLAAVEKTLFLNSMSHELDLDTEWDAFLNKQVQAHISTGKLKSAYLLSQYQTNLTDHIDMLGQLVVSFSKLNRKDLIESMINTLNQRIKEQPQEMQARYNAQVATILKDTGKKLAWFNNAETIAASVPDPIKQSFALSGIAVYQNRAGKTQVASQYFSRAEQKIKSLAPNFEQFSGYINLARDYASIHSNIYAEVVILQAKFLLSTFDAEKHEEGSSMLLDTAYLMDNAALIEQYTQTLKSSAYRSKSVYQTLQAQLKTNAVGDMGKQVSTIDDPDYAAVANATAMFLTAEPAQKKALEIVALQQLMTVKDTINKAVAASKVARYFYRLGNDKEAVPLFSQAFNWAKTIPEKDQKDAVLMILAIDKARVFLPEGANEVAELIAADHLKITTLDTIKNIQAIKNLVSQ